MSIRVRSCVWPVDRVGAYRPGVRTTQAEGWAWGRGGVGITRVTHRFLTHRLGMLVHGPVTVLVVSIEGCVWICAGIGCVGRRGKCLDMRGMHSPGAARFACPSCDPCPAAISASSSCGESPRESVRCRGVGIRAVMRRGCGRGQG